MNLFFQLLAYGIVNAALFAVLAVAFGIVYRSIRIFHIAFAGLYLLGPYASYLANTAWGFPAWLSISFGVAVGAGAAWFCEVVLYRPLMRRNASAAAVLIASLGTYVLITNAIAMSFGNEVKTIQRGLAHRIELGGIWLTSIQLWQFFLCGLAVVGIALAMKKIRAFKVIWAMGEEPELVPALGLPLKRYRAIVFIVSGALAALAGCLIGYDVGIDPHMGMSYLLIAAVAVLAGGMDSYKGWILGGTTVAILQTVTIWNFSAKWMDLVTFAVLILILVFRPQGMLGMRKRLEEG